MKRKKLNLSPPNLSGKCACGCGGITPIAKQGSSRYGHVAGEHVLYIHGHHRRGKKHTQEARSRMSQSTKAQFARDGHPWSGKHHSEETKRKLSEDRLGPKHWKFKGRRIDSEGYVIVYVGPDHPMSRASTPYVREHRLVMSEHLGRPLEPTEDVHHINGDKQDNRIENLQVIDHGRHSSAQRQRLHGAAIRGLLREGLSVGEVAEYLHMSPQTVRRYSKETP